MLSFSEMFPLLSEAILCQWEQPHLPAGLPVAMRSSTDCWIAPFCSWITHTHTLTHRQRQVQSELNGQKPCLSRRVNASKFPHERAFSSSQKSLLTFPTLTANLDNSVSPFPWLFSKKIWRYLDVCRNLGYGLDCHKWRYTILCRSI